MTKFADVLDSPTAAESSTPYDHPRIIVTPAIGDSLSLTVFHQDGEAGVFGHVSVLLDLDGARTLIGLLQLAVTR